MTVLSPDGEPIGIWRTNPNNGSWRILGVPPNVIPPGPRIPGRPSVRKLERHGEGWAFRMLPGELAPRHMEPLP